MPVFNAIAAMSENRVIGNQGKIPWHLPEDFRWFKHKTMGGTLIMGRKTFESIGKPLPGRKTLVLTHRPLDVPGVETCFDLAFLSNHLKSHPEETYWVAGGGTIYSQLRDHSSYLYLTRVKKTVEGDAKFPEFEDIYQLDQEIYDCPEFRIERWINKRLAADTNFKRLPDEPWPFPPKE